MGTTFSVETTPKFMKGAGGSLVANLSVSRGVIPPGTIVYLYKGDTWIDKKKVNPNAQTACLQFSEGKLGGNASYCFVWCESGMFFDKELARSDPFSVVEFEEIIARHTSAVAIRGSGGRDDDYLLAKKKIEELERTIVALKKRLRNLQGSSDEEDDEDCKESSRPTKKQR